MPTSDGLVVTTLSDVTDERSLARAHAISEEGHDVLLRSESIAELVDNMCAMLVRLDDHVLAWVALARDDPEHSVETVIAHGAVDYLYDGIVSWDPAEPRGRGPVGTALRDHIPALISDITADHSFAMWQPRAAAHGISSAVAIPFTMRGRNAALVVYARQPAAFNNRSLGVLARFGRDLEYGITNLTRHDQLRSALEATVQTIANINEVRDLYTSGHQRRVARLAAEIGRIIGLDEPALVALRLGALVHDVGKIAVPAEILSKPGPLHPCEIALVQRHADIGQQLLHTGALPDVVADIAGQHHERLNGSGYPQQLTGDDICIEARIVAVADVVEAIMHHRPYRPALGQQAALDTITAGAGTLFERDAVTACNTALNHGFTLDAPTSHDPHI